MTMIRKAAHGVSAVRNLVSYPFRFRRIGRGWRDGWTALLLRLSAGRGSPRAAANGRERTLRLKAVPTPLTLRAANSDFFVVRDVFENEDYASVRRMNLPPDARIVDLGANIGITSLYFASLYPDCTIVAVEPDPGNAGLLERNCAALIAAGRLTVVRAFAAAQDGAAGIDRTDRSWGFKKAAADAPAGGEQIPCVPIPAILERHPAGGERIDLLKCDIEGSEGEIFADCAGWIGRVRNLVIETHPPYSPELLYQHLRAAGWEFDVCDEQQRGPDFFVCALSRRG